MKRIMVLTLIIMSLYQVCFAFTPPDPNKWIAMTRSMDLRLWINAQTIRFEKNTDGIYGYVLVMAWVYPSLDELKEAFEQTKEYKKREPKFSSIEEMVFNMEKKEQRSQSVDVYDGDGTLIYSFSSAELDPFRAIPPNSAVAEIYEFMRLVHENSDEFRQIK